MLTTTCGSLPAQRRCGNRAYRTKRKKACAPQSHRLPNVSRGAASVFHSEQRKARRRIETSVKLSSVSELYFTLDANDERYAARGLGSQCVPRLRRRWAAYAREE